MAKRFQVKPADLAKVWSVPRSDSIKQFSVRIGLGSYQRITALERMFPGRSRNELIADLLATALEEFEEGLDMTWETVGRGGEADSICQDDEQVDVDFDPDLNEWGRWVGPRVQFRLILDQVQREDEELRASKPSPSLEVVETEEVAA